VLKIHINKIVPRSYATNSTWPGMFGAFPKDFPDGQVKYFYLDLDKKQLEFAPGYRGPDRPFPGTTAVAGAEPGPTAPSRPDRSAGNLDINEMVEGTSCTFRSSSRARCCGRAIPTPDRATARSTLTAIETAYKELNLNRHGAQEHDACLAARRTADPLDHDRPYDRDFNKAWDLLQRRPSSTWWKAAS